MKPTFYIASSRDGLPSVAAMARHLESIGMRDAFPWPEHFSHKCSTESCGIHDRSHLARCEIDAARACDLFVGIARLGRGAHVELGAALVRSPKRVILIGVDPAESVFYVATGVEHFASVPDAIGALTRWWAP